MAVVHHLSSPTTYRAIYQHWQRRLSDGGRSILLCADEALARHLAETLAQWQSAAAYLSGSPLWRDYQPLSGERHLSDQWLGLECDGLLLPLDGQLTANGLAAASGALRWGGVLIAFPATTRNGLSSYLLQCLTDSPLVLAVARLEPELPPAMQELQAVCSAQPEWMTEAAAQQHAIVDRMERLLRGRRHRPMLLSARRGRGKSSALGAVAARWCQSGASIVVLSPAIDNIRSLVERFEACGGEAVKTHRWQLGEGTLQWRPMDRYLEDPAQQSSADCLIIDEAAAFSFHQLEQCIAHPRVVMATTLEGYEGSGRGFRLRFLQWLSQQRAQWQGLELSLPMRWSARDELEPALDDWLLLRASESSEAGPDRAPEESSAAQVECLSHKQRRDLYLARPLMGLLQQAHHRNNPNDFQAFLEAGHLHYWLLRRGEEVDAAAVGIEEPPVEPELLTEIAAGRRRLPGQLLRQSLAFYCQNQKLAAMPGARIQRIATAFDLRRGGRASELLAQIEQQSLADAGEESPVWLGTSFPAEPALIRFWQKNGYQLIRLGLKPDRISGVPSVLAIKVIRSGFEDDVAALAALYKQRFFHGLNRHWRDLSPDHLIALWPESSEGGGAVHCSAQPMIEAYVNGGGDFMLWQADIHRCLSTAGLPHRIEDARVLVSAIFQGKPAAELGFRGKRELNDALRQMLKDYLFEKFYE